MRFFRLYDLFPLNRCRGLGGHIVEHAVDTGDLVYNAHRDAVEHVIRQAHPIGGHEVGGADGAESDRVIISAAVAHDADGAHVCQRREVLAQLPLKTGFDDLIAEDEVGLAQHIELLLSQRADDADAETGAGEGLAHDQILWQPKLAPELANLVLKEHAQRLDDLLEINIVGQAADVVVALNDRGVALAGLDNVRVDRALDKIVDLADLLAFLLKDADKLLTDDLALVLRLLNAVKSLEKTLLGIDADEVYVPLRKGLLDLVALVLAHKAMIDKHTGELIADGLGQERRRDRGVNAAGEGEQHLAAADLFTDGVDGALFIVRHRPVADRAADIIEEVVEHFAPVLGVVDLRVELHTVEAARLVAYADVRAGGGVGGEGKALRDARHIVAVAHPCDALFGDALEERAGGVKICDGLAVFTGGIVLRGGDKSA